MCRVWLLSRCGFLLRYVLVSFAGSRSSEPSLAGVLVFLAYLTSLFLRMHVVVEDARGLEYWLYDPVLTSVKEQLNPTFGDILPKLNHF